jgi:hypothetical protein
MAWVLPPAVATDADGVPVELSDAEHPLWTGPIGPYIAYMRERGWSLPARERMFVTTSEERGVDPCHGTYRGGAASRRAAAVTAWAREAGITSKRWPTVVNYHALRAMGLLSDRETA